VAGRKRKSDLSLIVALACGASPEQAAQRTGLGLRTVYRRLADTAFRAAVDEARQEMARRTANMLNAAGLGAVKTLADLQERATSESVRLGAAKAVIEQGRKSREALEWHDRLAALEHRIEGLLGEHESLPKSSTMDDTSAAGDNDES
jgi:hypothetical protein